MNGEQAHTRWRAPIDKLKEIELCLGIAVLDIDPIVIIYKPLSSARKPELHKNLIVCLTGLMSAGTVQH